MARIRPSHIRLSLALLLCAAHTSQANAASQEVRDKKSLGANVGISSRTGVGGGLGANFIYNVNKKVQLGVGVDASQWDGKESFQDQQDKKYKDRNTAEADRYQASEASYNATAISASVRLFLGNSFNINTSIGQRNVTGKYAISSSSDAATDRETTYTATGLVSNISIGNDWTFDNGCVLGFDWLGFATGFSNKSEVKESNVETGSQAGYITAQEDLKKFSDEKLGATTAYLLGVRLGWVF